MVALKIAAAFALISVAVSFPMEEFGIDQTNEELAKEARNAEEAEAAARNARFNFGYSIQV